MLKVGPAYEPGVEPASTTVLWKVPEIGEVAEQNVGPAAHATYGPITKPRGRVTENPGDRLPLHWTAVRECAVVVNPPALHMAAAVP